MIKSRLVGFNLKFMKASPEINFKYNRAFGSVPALHNEGFLFSFETVINFKNGVAIDYCGWQVFDMSCSSHLEWQIKATEASVSDYLTFVCEEQEVCEC